MSIYTKHNFHKHTFCLFQQVDNSVLTDLKLSYKSNSGSEYYFTEIGVYRKSNHWGRAANCRWRLITNSEYKNQKEIINVQDSSILSLSNEVYEINNINHQLRLNNSSKDSLLQSKDNLNELANKNIIQLKKELADNNTWIIRNGYWITFAIGFVGGAFLMR